MPAVRQDSLGGPDVLYLREVERPVPGIGEILIRVRAAGVNPADAMQRSRGGFGAAPPFTLGWDVSGGVAAPGPGVTIWKPGDEIFGPLPFPRVLIARIRFLLRPHSPWDGDIFHPASWTSSRIGTRSSANHPATRDVGMHDGYTRKIVY